MLQKIADQVYCAESELCMAGGVRFPLRMTVVRLPGDRLWLHSPIQIDDALAAEIEALGEVAFLVAPNCFHHLYVSKAKDRWPKAAIHAAPGLDEKRPDLPIDAVLDDQAPQAWGGVFAPYVVGGAPKLGEVVFVHRPSESLIVTDLLFNIQQPKGWQAKLAFSLVGVRGRFAQSRLIRMLTKNRSHAAESCRRLLGENFQRVIMTHGDIVTEDAHQRTAQSLRWMLA